MEEEDDEETIEVEEQQEGNDAESRQREIELLKEEGLLPLDQLLSTLHLPQVQMLPYFIFTNKAFRNFLQTTTKFWNKITGSLVWRIK